MVFFWWTCAHVCLTFSYLKGLLYKYRNSEAQNVILQQKKNRTQPPTSIWVEEHSQRYLWKDNRHALRSSILKLQTGWFPCSKKVNTSKSLLSADLLRDSFWHNYQLKISISLYFSLKEEIYFSAKNTDQCIHLNDCPEHCRWRNAITRELSFLSIVSIIDTLMIFQDTEIFH